MTSELVACGNTSNFLLNVDEQHKREDVGVRNPWCPSRHLHPQYQLPSPAHPTKFKGDSFRRTHRRSLFTNCAAFRLQTFRNPRRRLWSKLWFLCSKEEPMTKRRRRRGSTTSLGPWITTGRHSSKVLQAFSITLPFWFQSAIEYLRDGASGKTVSC